MRWGVDISANNHWTQELNWRAIAEELEQLGSGQPGFVIIKACQGSGYVNPYFHEDVAGAQAHGLAVGAYLMTEGDAGIEAQVDTFKATAGDLPACLDVELPRGLSYPAYAQQTRDILRLMPDAAVYLSEWFVSMGFPGGAGLWLADYNNAPGKTPYPALMQQTAMGYTIPGCRGVFDLDVFCGPEESFNSFFHLAPQGGHVSTPTTPPELLPGLSASPVAVVPAKGQGYWLVCSDGSVFSHGDAVFHGSLYGQKLNAPIVGAAVTQTGNGYWLVGSDGGVYCFGDAPFCGSLGAVKLDKPIVGIAPYGDSGYWLVGADGGIFTFGGAAFEGAGA